MIYDIQCPISNIITEKSLRFEYDFIHWQQLWQRFVILTSSYPDRPHLMASFATFT